MFYRNYSTAGYLKILCIFLRGNFKDPNYKVFLWERNAQLMPHVFKLKNNPFNNNDFNIDQNNR